MRSKHKATGALLVTLLLLGILTIFMIGAALDCTPDMVLVCGK